MGGAKEAKALLRRSKGTLDMTEGSIWRLLLAFAFPMMLGNIFQQLYNTVDSYVVGNFVSKEALAAVGSAGPIISTLIGLFSGLASGAGIVVSQYFGAKQEDMVRKTVETAVVMTLFMCVLFTALGILGAPMMLRFMGTPEGIVWDYSRSYLTIYFAGATGLMLYNIGAGILRAVGNTRAPLIALVISALTNVTLDLLFVVKLKMEVRGVAWATVIAEAVSTVYVFTVLMTAKGPHRLRLFRMRFYKNVFLRIFRIGIPSAVQMAITSFSNTFVQSYVYAYGAECMAGYTIYAKVDSFAMVPFVCLNAAHATFAGQNMGAGKTERLYQGLKVARIMNFIVVTPIVALVVLFRSQLASVFNSDPTVIHYAGIFLLCITPGYLVGAFNDPLVGLMQGCGQTRAPMLTGLGSFVVFRQIYLAVFTRLTSSFIVIGIAYPLGWAVRAVSIFLYHKLSHWERKYMHLELTETSAKPKRAEG